MGFTTRSAKNVPISKNRLLYRVIYAYPAISPDRNKLIFVIGVDLKRKKIEAATRQAANISVLAIIGNGAKLKINKADAKKASFSENRRLKVWKVR